MKKYFINLLAWFLIATILVAPAFIKFCRYETAVENGYEIEAVVVDYKTRIESVEYTDDSEVYILYVDYEVDGKEYKNVKAGEFGKIHLRGETITIVVNPKNPGKIIQDSDMFTGVLCIVGMFIAVYGIVAESKTMKKNKATKEND
ncbi:MAG: hypothetical protein J6Q94_08840 [Clostridia bacterium]|nr:hypothetical protein [Clostridia bacterium]